MEVRVRVPVSMLLYTTIESLTQHSAFQIIAMVYTVAPPDVLYEACQVWTFKGAHDAIIADLWLNYLQPAGSQLKP